MNMASIVVQDPSAEEQQQQGGAPNARCHSTVLVGKVPHKSNTDVRSRYLNRLGISDQKSNAFLPRRLSFDDSTQQKRRAKVLLETLKGDNGQAMQQTDSELPLFRATMKKARSFIDCSSDSSSTRSASSVDDISNSSNGLKCCHKNVSFENKVSVYVIPHHAEFSDRIRKTIWTTKMEMKKVVARNALEFSAENWDWRQVNEEQDMVLYKGERVHPVHFKQEDYYVPQLVRSKQQQKQQQQQKLKAQHSPALSRCFGRM